MPVLAFFALGLLVLGGIYVLEKRPASGPIASPEPSAPRGAASPSVVVNAAPMEARQATAGPIQSSLPFGTNLPSSRPTDLQSTADLTRSLASALPGLVSSTGNFVNEYRKTTNAQELALRQVRPNDLASSPQAKSADSILAAPAGIEGAVNVFGASDGLVSQDVSAVPYNSFGGSLDAVANPSPYAPGGGAGVNEGGIGSGISPQTEAPSEIFTSLPGNG